MQAGLPSVFFKSVLKLSVASVVEKAQNRLGEAGELFKFHAAKIYASGVARKGFFWRSSGMRIGGQKGERRKIR